MKKFLYRDVGLICGLVCGLSWGLLWGQVSFADPEPPSANLSDSVEGLPESLPESLTESSNREGPRTVREIQVQGLKRIEKEAVLAKIGTKPGSTLRAEQIQEDIQALFKMGYFEDISVEAFPVSREKLAQEKLNRGDSKAQLDIVYHLRERPTIAQVEFEGNERVSTSDLKDVVKVKDWSILDVNKVKEDVALIQKHYEDKGFYLAKVGYQIKQLKPDEVAVIYTINDYDKVQIKKITFLNNKKFSDDQLKSVFAETKEGGLLSFLSNAGNFKESAFKQDLQRLTYWYLEHGYIKFKTGNPIVTISDDKKWLFISISVDEGEQYQIGNIDFGGDLLFPKDELSDGITLTSGEIFGITKRNQDIQRLTEKYQDLGYAFVNVIPKMNIHDETQTVDIEYDFEKGNLVYFGEINILGNSKTYDKVIRRELKIREGELFSGTKLRESRENVERLGYFAPGEVIFNTVTPKGKPNLLNVEISVKERSTGTITLGAGYGGIQGFFFTTQVSEINLLGRGQTLSLSAQYSVQQLSQSLNLGFTEPYTFDTRWTTGFDLYNVKYLIPNRYYTAKNGFDVKFGHPLWEFTNFLVTYKLEGTQVLYPADQIPLSERLADSGVLSSVIWSLVRDKRNNRFETTGGNYQSLSLETAGLGGDMKFIKWILNNRFYHRIIGDLVFRNSTEIGQITGYSGAPVPPSQRFFLGGPNNMKGFQLYQLGPMLPGTLNTGTGSPIPMGGDFEAMSLFEVEYPLIREAGIKAVAFFDAGNTVARGTPFELRLDAGFGFRWFSPIGPLRFEWGFPLDRRPGEPASVFQFFIGPPF